MRAQLFVMSEVAVNLFQESPTVLGKDLRAGRYLKYHSTNEDLIKTVQDLELPAESFGGSKGITLVPSETLQALLVDKRRAELVRLFQLSLLKLSSQEASRFMASGDYEQALPVALDAVKQGQVVFTDEASLQLFPLYLLAAQANLGLRQAKQCEDFLGLASWLALKDAANTTHLMRSQLSRLFGQLYSLQGKFDNAIHAFSEDMYYCSLEYGPQDLRTSLGYYNLAKVFQNKGDSEKSIACAEQIIHIWVSAMKLFVLQIPPSIPGMTTDVPLGETQLMEVEDMLDDIIKMGKDLGGDSEYILGDAVFTLGLMRAYVGDMEGARFKLEQAIGMYPAEAEDIVQEVESALEKVKGI